MLQYTVACLPFILHTHIYFPCRRPCWRPKLILWELNSFLLKQYLLQHLLIILCFSWKALIFLTSKTFVYRTIFSTNMFKHTLKSCACQNKIKKHVQRIIKNKTLKWNYHVELIFGKCLDNEQNNRRIDSRVNKKTGKIALNDLNGTFRCNLITFVPCCFLDEQMVGHLPSFFVLTLAHSNDSDEFAIFF